MTRSTSHDIERSTARCRVLLSFVVFVLVCIDAAPPAFSRWSALGGGARGVDLLTVAVMVAHLSYSLLTYHALVRGWLSASNATAVTIWCDVFFAAAIALCTEGTRSPFYVFFAFAVVAVGFRAGFRRSMIVTAVSVALYLSLWIVSSSAATQFNVMRPVYLVIIGYLVAYLGQERFDLEAEIRRLETAKERTRIARDLHDGYLQTLAGINLRLASCRELLRRGRGAAAAAELVQLQENVIAEYDDFRRYMRALAGVDATPAHLDAGEDTRFSVDMVFNASGLLVDQVLQIVRAGVINVRRHAHARGASVQVRAQKGDVLITIEDDGVGFSSQSERPWSITSRVSEFDGQIEVKQEPRSGARLSIALPRG